ncbi:MAG: hypothetical protein GXX04_11385 [Clostridiaceae bacterium]|nr:hypothetical protein [Clostridiaceae bacterium]
MLQAEADAFNRKEIYGGERELLEKDLYEPVKKWLEGCGFTPRAEVRHCDVVAVKGDIVLAVEMKTSLNLDVILQAVDRQRFCDLVYIAVPKKGRVIFTRRWKMLCHLLRRLELGLLLVNSRDGEQWAEESIAPLPFDRVRSRQQSGRKRKLALEEFKNRHGDYNVGGSSGSRLVTAYREQALLVASHLSRNGPMTPKALRELGCDKKKTLGILYDNHYGWFEHVSRGLYGLSDKGRKALEEYQQIIKELE